MTGPRALAVAVGALSAAALTAGPATAQSWRTLEVSRQLKDSAGATIRVVHGTGRVGVRATTSPLLYHMVLRYDAERAQPVHAFDAATRALQLGMRRADVRLSGGDDARRADELQLELSRGTPLDLSLELGAAETDLDLTGLRITRLRVESGANSARLRFDSLNASRMSLLQVSTGAASLRAERLANANASEIHVDAGIGNVELDFGGTWTRDIELRVEVSLGMVTLHVPADVGVQVAFEKLLAAFEHEGLAKRDGAYVSSNWDTAPRKLRVRAETVFGKLTIDRTGR